MPIMCDNCEEFKQIEKLKALIKKHDINCGEAIYQRDSISENALDILGEICDIVGYYEEGEE
jgi:hypothetical protein